MKVLIFGATGTLGLHLVEQALDSSLSVIAFTRHPDKLKHLQHPQLSITKGDVNRLADVEEAMSDADAVLCALGDGAKGKIRASGTLHIIRAMETKGIKRLVCQTTIGLGESRANLNFFWKYIMFGFFLRKAFQDHQLQEQYIFKSNLDYTIVRPSAFTNEPLSNHYKFGFGPDEKDLTLKISRASIASFMIKQLSSEVYIGKTVSISN